MEIIVNFIMQNYIWFIAGSIIILLAVIGYYADKTNFGQGKNKEQDIKIEKDLTLQKMQEDIDSSGKNNSIEKAKIEENKEVLEKLHNPTENSAVIDITPQKNDSNNIAAPGVSSVNYEKNELNNNKIEILEKSSEDLNLNGKNDTEMNFESFDKEFEEILPKKEIIDDELLDEIENLSLDKTQKLNINDIPVLDDLELPKIKSMKTEEQDIWKF